MKTYEEQDMADMGLDPKKKEEWTPEQKSAYNLMQLEKYAYLDDYLISMWLNVTSEMNPAEVARKMDAASAGFINGAAQRHVADRFKVHFANREGLDKAIEKGGNDTMLKAEDLWFEWQELRKGNLGIVTTNAGKNPLQSGTEAIYPGHRTVVAQWMQDFTDAVSEATSLPSGNLQYVLPLKGDGTVGLDKGQPLIIRFAEEKTYGGAKTVERGEFRVKFDDAGKMTIEKWQDTRGGPPVKVEGAEKGFKELPSPKSVRGQRYREEPGTWGYAEEAAKRGNPYYYWRY
jgi:hypothetical protein